MKSISIVIPVYNEVNNIEPLYSRLHTVISKCSGYRFELVFADNHSSDGTIYALEELAKSDSQVKIIINQANYGVAYSHFHALYSCNTDASIMMCGDLEDPPELIPEFIKKWESGYKVVFGQYKKREQNIVYSFFRPLYYFFIKRFSDFKLEKNVSGFCLLDNTVVQQLRQIYAPNPNIFFMTAELKYPIEYVSYDKPKRETGTSHFTFIKYVKLALNNIITCSQAPLKLISLAGIIISTGSIGVAIVYFIRKIIYWDSFELGLAPLVIGQFFLGGIQILFLGVIGQYIGLLQNQITKKPYVIEDRRINFKNKED